MYWGMYQSGSDTQAAMGAARAESAATNLREQLRILEDKVDSLALVCQAQWELIRDNTGLSEADIVAKAQEIDLRDGREDQRMGRARRDCPRCERPLHARHDRCLYCGHELGRDHVFDS